MVAYFNVTYLYTLCGLGNYDATNLSSTILQLMPSTDSMHYNKFFNYTGVIFYSYFTIVYNYSF